MDRTDPKYLLDWGDPPSRPLSAGLTAAGAAPLAPADADADGLLALSTLLLQLHRGARDWPPATVLARSVELLADRLPFDGLCWSLVAADPAAPSGEAESVLFQQGPAPTDGPQWLAVQGEPLAASRVVLRLWRAAGSPPFSVADARLLPCVLPHLVDLWRQSRFLPRGAGDAAHGGAARCRAVCDSQGRLQQVDDSAVALLRLEWPHSAAAGLPLALRRWVVAAATAQAAAPHARFHGRHITVDLHVAGELMQIELRRRAPVDRLSPHQRDIADRYAAGRSAPQIARDLGLSPSTVDKHLGVVFRKLAVNSKLQLAQRLRETTGSR